MRHLLAAFALLCLSTAALAVGPQDLTVTFQTRPSGGAVQGHRL